MRDTLKGGKGIMLRCMECGCASAVLPTRRILLLSLQLASNDVVKSFRMNVCEEKFVQIVISVCEYKNQLIYQSCFSSSLSRVSITCLLVSWISPAR